MTTSSHLDPSRTFVLVDPTSPDGEAALALLEPTDTHVGIVVLLTGRSSAALREFANCENIDLASAASIYLEQVAERISIDGRLVETISTVGPDPARDLGDLVTMNDTRRVLVPASLKRIDRSGFRSLLARVDCIVSEETLPAHAA